MPIAVSVLHSMRSLVRSPRRLYLENAAGLQRVVSDYVASYMRSRRI